MYLLKFIILNIKYRKKIAQYNIFIFISELFCLNFK